MIVNTTLQYNSEAAAGTGIVINADGLVLTNNHVIDHATKITATAASTGTTYTATVVGYDKTGDIALIQLRNASGLTVKHGSATPPRSRPGTPVVALGNAEGQGSITAKPGRVTGLGQTVTASEDGGSTASETLHGMIQLNAEHRARRLRRPASEFSRLIGMDTAGSDGSTQQASTGFAIPINTALSVARQIAGCSRATPAPPSRSATRHSRDSSPVPDRTAAPGRRHSSRAAASAAASGTPRGATPAIPA